LGQGKTLSNKLHLDFKIAAQLLGLVEKEKKTRPSFTY
jgi:hypothetical protein